MLDQIGKYKITRVIGKGAMGVVYEAFDPDIERRVAIKMLKANGVEQSLVEEFQARFKIEAQAAARCMHPNIVTILEYGSLHDAPYMVMEYLQGVSLADLLRSKQPLKFNRVLRIFTQVLKGLHFAHQNGVVHRDVKPSNIMVLKNDAVKITDFGIARVPLSNDVTQLGFSVGTPNYMAIEQQANSKVDGRADLFALSVILLELLAKVPFSKKIEHKTLSPSGIYITPKVDMNQPVPLPFKAVLQRGLAAKREHRFADAKAYAAALKKAMLDIKMITGGNNERTDAQLYQKHIEPEIRASHLLELEQMLTQFVGPISRSLIDVYAEQIGDMDELVQQLAEEIPSELDRTQFIKTWKNGKSAIAIRNESRERAQSSGRVVVKQTKANPAHTYVPMLNKEAYQKVEAVYADFVGPMADILLQEGLDIAGTFDELVDALLESIPNKNDQTDFIVKVKQLAVP